MICVHIRLIKNRNFTENHTKSKFLLKNSNMNGTHFAHPKCAIIAHQIDHLRKMLESYPREIEIFNAIPAECLKCVIGNIKKLEVPVKSKEFKLESFF